MDPKLSSGKAVPDLGQLLAGRVSSSRDQIADLQAGDTSDRRSAVWRSFELTDPATSGPTRRGFNLMRRTSTNDGFLAS